ncbi:MAG: DUF1127 domain-containing protein [Roseibium sp.]|uniref:DUF1127 domain-containing protein n=1 Tax=Roseibium sp. TaxID=1936156 RepID=UPI003D9C4264
MITLSREFWWRRKMTKGSQIHPVWQAAGQRTRLSPWLEHFLVWRKMRRDRLELASLGDAVLKDLAIDRSEIPSIIHAKGNERRRRHGD